MAENTNELVHLLPFLAPLILLEFGLLIFALVDVIRRKRVRGDNKIIWVLIIVLIEIIGPCLYLLFGRKEEVVDGDQD